VWSLYTGLTVILILIINYSCDYLKDSLRFVNELNKTLPQIREKFSQDFGRLDEVVFVRKGSHHFLEVHVGVVELLLQ